MDDVEDSTAAMAEAMGFSSFGANPSKRRKYNPHTDEAVVASSSTTTIPLHHNNAQETSSGANATPLGVRIQNEDEVDLDEDEDGASLSNKEGHGPAGDDGNDAGPQYLDTSRPSTAAPTDSLEELQAKINAITGASSAELLESSPNTVMWPGIKASRGNNRGGSGTQGRREAYKPSWAQGGDSDRKWWIDYYDPSTNINPWERLEESHNLGSRGSWMSWEEAKEAKILVSS
ncbi:hypothetical protein F4819DRAFT_230919 [Hypoxylon fuscum]|nr:hypothetical protein F4819DRAFT_230919 [Hypoxylon fuscum]